MQFSDQIVNSLHDLKDRFSVFFSSDVEMFFYIFCFIAFHMIMVNLFYGKPTRRKHKSLNMKRSLLIVMVVAEIVLFTNLLTLDYFADTLHPPQNGQYSHSSVHDGYGH